MVNVGREIHEKATKNLLDIIVLQLLNEKARCGYEVMSAIRKAYGISFGASTIYPMLASIEKKRLIHGEWDCSGKRPKKVYCITPQGRDVLHFAATSLNTICRNFVSPKKEVESLAFTINQ